MEVTRKLVSLALNMWIGVMASNLPKEGVQKDLRKVRIGPSSLTVVNPPQKKRNPTAVFVIMENFLDAFCEMVSITGHPRRRSHVAVGRFEVFKDAPRRNDSISLF